MVQEEIITSRSMFVDESLSMRIKNIYFCRVYYKLFSFRAVFFSVCRHVGRFKELVTTVPNLDKRERDLIPLEVHSSDKKSREC